MTAPQQPRAVSVTCTREQHLLAMIAAGHPDARVAAAALQDVRDAHQCADNTLSLLKPRPEVGPE